MELKFRCLKCDAWTRREVTAGVTESLVCASCGDVRPCAWRDAADASPARCANCATDDLYVQKDFPQNLGLAILVAGFALASVFWLWYMPLVTYAILLISVALDAALYALVPDVVICYRCLSQHRGRECNPGGRYRSFDLEIGERYRQERIRAEELRRLGRTTAARAGGAPGK